MEIIPYFYDINFKQLYMKKTHFLLIAVISILLCSCGTQNIEFKNADSVPYLVVETINSTVTELPDSVELPHELYTVSVSGKRVYIWKFINKKLVPAYNIDISNDNGGVVILCLLLGAGIMVMILGLGGAFD